MGEMIADFFTKPLQGTLFQKFRNFIMNCDPLINSPQDHRSVLGKTEMQRRPNGGRADGANITVARTVALAREPQEKVSLANEWTIVKRS
jgi:hypothetical protein